MTATASLPLPAPQPITPPAEKAVRFVFVDALRGLAAIGVVACHFVPKSPLMPQWVDSLMRMGSLGVQVFFVISGFVIAYSVRGARIDARYLGNFAFRRALRLDPPYWATIACILVIGPWTQALAPSAEYVAPSVPQVLCHLCYIQTFLGYQDLCVIFWTLRLEVLFYLSFIIMLGVAQRVARLCGANESSPAARLWVVLPPALLSLAAFTLGRGPGVLQYFHMFLLGACVWWALANQISSLWVLGLAAAMAGSVTFRHGWDIPVALAAAGSVYAAGRLHKLGSWLDYRPLQHLGRISYSLYLIHAPVGGLILAAYLYVTGAGPWNSITGNVIAVAGSFVAAEILYRFVEKPSIEWARRFKRPARAS